MKRQQLMTALVAASFVLAGAAKAAAEPVAEVDPAAMQALHAMGDYLRGLKSFGLTADETRDEVLESGQKIERSSTVQLEVRKPNGLRANIQTDLKAHQLYFDGKSFTLFGPQTGLYATVPAPGTIRELLALVEPKYGLEMPLVDLFQWGTDADSSADIQQALVIGPSNLGGKMTTHYAFRQEGIDWQIWIAQGDQPLPLRYVITTLDDPSQPEFRADLSWDAAAQPDAAAFTFVPAEGNHPIAIVDLDQSSAAE